MRIKSLIIDGYKIFNPSPKIILGKELQLLIGQNGTGKSTVLEAIAIIFSQVKEYCEKPKIRERKFNFSIEYSITSNKILEETTTSSKNKISINHIFLSTSKETGLQFTMYVNDIPIETTEEMYQYLPDNLIFYYAGSCDTLKSIVKETEEKQAIDFRNKRNSDSIIKVINSLVKNVIYIREEYFPLLFALNYIDREQILPLSYKKFSIRNIIFEIQKPSFTSNKDYKNLYNLSGFLRTFLDNLLKHSYGIEVDNENDIEEPYFSIDFHRGIIEAIEDLPELTDDQRFNQTRFIAFHIISLLFRIGLIKKISISINDENNNVFLIDDFSEGEQQLIILDSIKKVLCKENSVLFLDEPDSYLHPQRQREIIPYLNKVFTESYTQIIATSHSPFVAQSVDLDSIIVFGSNGTILPNPTEQIDSYSTITNELFNIKTEFNSEIEIELNKFKDFRNKIINNILYDKADFKSTIQFLESKGDEVKAIVNRELNQLLKINENLLKNG